MGEFSKRYGKKKAEIKNTISDEDRGRIFTAGAKQEIMTELVMA